MDDTSPGNRQRTTHFFSLFLCFAFSPPSIYFFLLRQMFTESNWHVRSPRSSDRESQPEKQRWPSHRSSSFAMISNSHFKKKLGSTIWISKENKKKGKWKRKKEDRNSFVSFLPNSNAIFPHESLKEEGGELRLWLAQKNRSTTNIRLTQKPKIQFPFKNTKKQKKAKAVKLDYLLFLRVRSRERL